MIKGENGISLIVLIIIIIVTIILSTVGMSHTTKVIDSAQEASYKQELSEAKSNLSTYYAHRYLYSSKWFDSLEMHWEGENLSPVNTMKMDGVNEDSIEKILGPLSKTMRKDLRIFNGDLRVSSNAPEKHINWASQLGILSGTEKIDVLKIPANSEIKYKNTINIKCENGKIILNGKMPSGTKGIFAKISNELFVDSTSSTIPIEEESLGNTKVGDRITLLTNKISGSYTFNDSREHQFNVCVRNAKNEAAYKVDLLAGDVGTTGFISNTITYAYVFIRGNITFDNYTFSVQVLKDIENQNSDKYSNLGIRVGEIEGLASYGLSINVDKNDIVTIKGLANIPTGNMHVLLNHVPTFVVGSTDKIPSALDLTKNLAVNGDKITLRMIKESGSVNLHTREFNVTLRGATDGASTLNGTNMSFLNKNGESKASSGTQFNCKYRDDIFSCTGTVSTGPAYSLGLFIQNGVEFDNLKLKIELIKE